MAKLQKLRSTAPKPPKPPKIEEKDKGSFRHFRWWDKEELKTQEERESSFNAALCIKKLRLIPLD